MAEYYALLARAISRLQSNTEVTRREIYVKARNALIQQLKAINPPLSAAEISKQRLELEEAVRKIERELLAAQLAHATEAEISRDTERAMEEALAEPEPPPVRQRAAEPAAAAFARAEPMREAAPARETAPPQGFARTEPPRTPPQGFTRTEPMRETAPPRAAQPASGFIRAEPQRETAPPRAAQPASGFTRAEPQRDAAPPRPAPAPPPRRAAPPAPEPLADDDAFEPAPPPPAPAPPPAAAASRPAAARLSRPATPRPATPPPPQRPAAATFTEAEAAELAEGARPARPARGRAAAPAAARRPARGGASVGRIIAFLILVVLVGGGYYAWVNREAVMDFFEERFGANTAAEGGVDVLPGGVEGDVRIVGPQAANGAVVATPPPPPQAIFYEERADGVTTPGVDATIHWRLVPDALGPIIRAVIEVPSRGIGIELSIEENHNPAFAYTHEIDILVTVPAGFDAGGVASVTSIAVKSTEEGIGDILAGVSQSLPPEFFWIELAAENGQQNLTRLRTRSWFDLAITYTNGQRAVLTFEKGAEGEVVFREAVAAWTAN